jgi:alpha-N-acetylglucosaminidase
MIDVSRQVFANGFIPIYDELIWAWTSGNSTRLEIFGDLIVDLLSTLDVILSFEETFRVDKWIKDARRWSGGDDEYADFLEYNARNQVDFPALGQTECVCRSPCGVPRVRSAITHLNNGLA